MQHPTPDTPLSVLAIELGKEACEELMLSTRLTDIIDALRQKGRDVFVVIEVRPRTDGQEDARHEIYIDSLLALLGSMS